MRPVIVASLLLVSASVLRAQESPLIQGDSILPFRGGRILWVRNSGPDTVWVDTLFVTRCTNIHPCGAVLVALPVPPGERRDLLRLTPRTARDPFGYGWTLSWRIVVPAQMRSPPD